MTVRLSFLMLCAAAGVAGCDDDPRTSGQNGSDAAPGADVAPDAEPDGGAGPDAEPDAEAEAEAAPDAATGAETDAAAEAEVGPGPEAVPLIHEALAGACPNGTPPPQPGVTAGTDLLKVTVARPEARCNDGSPAVYYVRRAATPADEGRWVFHVQGGGSCDADYATCVERWCGQGNPYGPHKMSSLNTPAGMAGKALFERAPDNVLGDANHVWIYYCSSDTWQGTKDDVIVTDPEDATQQLRMHFRGHTILEAVFGELLAGPVTSDDGSVTVPSLAEATHVVVTGTSAGSIGVQQNVDWIAAQLPAAAAVYAVFDAAVAPSPATVPDPDAAAALSAAFAARYERSLLFGAFYDASCLAHHAADPEACAGNDHNRLNHVTTPFFARMDLGDQNNYKNYAAFGVSLAAYATWNRASLLLLLDAQSTGEEGAALPRPPSLYAPACGQHVGITSPVWYAEATVTDPAGAPTTFRDALARWLDGEDLAIVDTVPPSLSTCSPTDDATD